MRGFETALVVFADSVPSSEWMTYVWRQDAWFESVDEAEARSALMRHFESIARTLPSAATIREGARSAKRRSVVSGC